MKQSLGFGLYVEFQNYRIILTTEYGEDVTNVIYLEPEIINSLQPYLTQKEASI